MADVEHLHPELLSRVKALIAASGGKVTMTSAYRSPERQAQLFAAAVAKYGSEAAARKWVAPPGHSDHGKGEAVDLGGDLNLARQLAASYGLAAPMPWEKWHFSRAEYKSAPGAPRQQESNGLGAGLARARAGGAVAPVGKGVGMDPGASAPVTNPLAANPAYLAFVRELGISDAEAASDLTTSTEAIGRQLTRRLPRLADAGVRQREQVSGSYESRGLLHSGQHEIALARQRGDEASGVSDIVEGGVDQVASLQSALARRRADSARRAAAGALSFAGPAYVGEG